VTFDAGIYFFRCWCYVSFRTTLAKHLPSFSFFPNYLNHILTRVATTWFFRGGGQNDCNLLHYFREGRNLFLITKHVFKISRGFPSRQLPGCRPDLFLCVANWTYSAAGLNGKWPDSAFVKMYFRNSTDIKKKRDRSNCHQKGMHQNPRWRRNVKHHRKRKCRQLLKGISSRTTKITNAVSPVGMCIVEHLEVLEYSGIFISNPEYRILFRNNLLRAKWPDRAEV